MSEAYDYTKGFADRAQVSLRRRDRLRTPLAEGTDRAAGHRVRSLGSLPDPDSLRDLAAELRDAVLARLDDHLEALAENWEANGGRTFFAADAKEANDYVAGIVRRTGARTAVKSKSMVSEEIRLNHMLQGLGVDVVETDLGEYIIQMAGEHPSHIVAPAIHRSRQDVARIFSALAGRELPDDAPSLMTFARERLRQRFLSADIGFSGCNFAVSSQGAVCLVTNEGNARMCTSLPKVHVALMGMERVVAGFEDLAVMLALLGRSGTGQKLTQYTTLLFGPRKDGERDGPDESHLVVVDNGRSEILGSRYGVALRCIRCGACLNVCPVFRQLGGHAYDPVYSGPIGAVITPLLKKTDEARELAHASTLCGACTEVCPVRIPLHDLLLELRQDYARASAGGTEHALYEGWSHAWATPGRYRAFAVSGELLGRATRSRPLRRVPLPVISRWTRGRAFPGFPRRIYRSEKD